MRSPLEAAAPSVGRVFFDTAQRFPDRVALVLDETRFTYAQLAERAAKIATLLAAPESTSPRLGAILTLRTITAYEGILATLASGAGYVPLNPKFPDEQNLHMLDVSGATTLVVGDDAVQKLDALLPSLQRSLLVVLPTLDDVSSLVARYPTHRFVGRREVIAAQPLPAPLPVERDAMAVLLFTSGSTGVPKGVMVTHANILRHLDVMWRRYEFDEHDRFSHTFPLTFDLSMFDMFACWGSGASLYSLPPSLALAADRFIVDNELTVWFSVPSMGMTMRKRGKLTPGAFPSLRRSLFCGERLPSDIAAAWQTAAPSSIVDNLYGPTEVTIACTLYRWDPATSPAKSVNGVVPIGLPYEGMTAAVVDTERRLVANGERGELCMRGPQVTAGYWRAPEKTAVAFVQMPWDDGAENRWYRTGDIAFVDADGDLVHCGREDGQVKLRGYRIELAEIEHALRQVAGTSYVAVLPFPADELSVRGLTAIVAITDTATDEAALQGALSAKLPAYMVPNRVLFLRELPHNSNGKIDRKQLLQLLRDGALD